MRLLVLGAAAGGGFPQWNCACPGCRRARAGDPLARSRTQSSVAVSADGQRWVLLNASPDLRAQILANPALAPEALLGTEGVRGSPLAAAVLTNADVDHVAGLLTLREMQPLAVYGTARVHRVLESASVFQVLNADLVARRPFALGAPFTPTDRDGVSLGLEIEAFAVPGKVALYLEDSSQPGFGSVAEDTVALHIRPSAGGPGLYYIPGCASIPDWLAERLRGAALLLLDGTTWTDDEMIRFGTGTKSAARMGHIPMSGPDGSMAVCAGLGIARKVFIHINNTNPVLLDDSPEHAAARAAGWEIAYDGLELTL